MGPSTSDKSPGSPEYLGFWLPETGQSAKFTAVFSLLDWDLIWNVKAASDHWEKQREDRALSSRNETVDMNKYFDENVFQICFEE